MIHREGTFSNMRSLQPRSLLRDLGDWGYTLNKQNCNNPGYCPACKERMILFASLFLSGFCDIFAFE